MKNFNFDVQSGMSLSLESLWATVKVKSGTDGKALVSIDGDEKLIDQIEVTQPAPDQILIKGKDNQGGITVVSGGGQSVVSIGSINTGGRSFVGGRVIVSGGSIVTSGDLVVVGGKVVSGGDDVTVIEGNKIPEIIVTVPIGTNLDVYSVERTESIGLGGKLSASLSGQQRIEIQSVSKIKASCSGQSNIHATQAKGDLKASASGQSAITVVGNLDDVELYVSGQSQIMVSGDCKKFEGAASGQSSISVTGKVKGKLRKHADFTSRIMANN